MFTKDIFSIFEPVFDKKQHEWENISWQCLNKQQHCVQFEIRNWRFCSSRAILKGFFISKFGELRRALRRFPKGKFARAGVYERHHRSFSLDLAIFNLATSTKSMRKRRERLQMNFIFFPYFRWNIWKEKSGLFFEKWIHSNQSFAAYERSLNQCFYGRRAINFTLQ